MSKHKDLDANDITPLYSQLKTIIKNKINLGEYHENDKIPSENELSIEYKVSRVTVRKAIEELVEEGFLTRKKGKGSFVNQKKEFDKIDYFTGFTSSMRKHGMSASSVLLKRRIIPADEDLAEHLHINIGDEVLYIERIRKANDKPVILEHNYFSLEKYGFLINEDLSGSLYDILKKRDILAIHPGTTTLELFMADHEVAEKMNLPFHTPFFFIKTVICDQQHEPVHVGRQFYLAEVYRFHLQ